MSYGSPEWQSWVLQEEEAIKHKDKHKKSQFEPLPSERHNINLHCQLWGCFPFANLFPDENQALNQDQ